MTRDVSFVRTRADTNHALATTGVDSARLSALATLLLLGGLAMLFAGRRRQRV